MRRVFVFTVRLALPGILALHAGVPVMSAALFKNGVVDHLLCCGVGGPVGLEGLPVRGAMTLAAAQPPVTPRAPTAASPAPAPVSAIPQAGSPPASSAGPVIFPEVDGVVQAGFEQLAGFTIEEPGFDPSVSPEQAMAAVARQIPEAVKKIDGRPAQVTGFMLPIKMEGLLVREFLLMRDQLMCCYGMRPRINDWVVVSMTKATRYTPDVPVSFRGKLRVGPMQDSGFLTGIYHLSDGAEAKR